MSYSNFVPGTMHIAGLEVLGARTHMHTRTHPSTCFAEEQCGPLQRKARFRSGQARACKHTTYSLTVCVKPQSGAHRCNSSLHEVFADLLNNNGISKHGDRHLQAFREDIPDQSLDRAQYVGGQAQDEFTV